MVRNGHLNEKIIELNGIFQPTMSSSCHRVPQLLLPNIKRYWKMTFAIQHGIDIEGWRLYQFENRRQQEQDILSNQTGSMSKGAWTSKQRNPYHDPPELNQYCSLCHSAVDTARMAFR
jgi:hypothetical protein